MGTERLFILETVEKIHALDEQVGRRTIRKSSSSLDTGMRMPN